MSDELQYLADVLAKMTPGPWCIEDKRHLKDWDAGTYAITAESKPGYGKCIAEDSPYYNTAPDFHDARGIALLVNLAPLLLDVVRAAQDCLDWDTQMQLGEAMTALNAALAKERGKA